MPPLPPPRITRVTYAAQTVPELSHYLYVTPFLQEEEKGVAKVELRLFGYEPQVLTEANLLVSMGWQVPKYRFEMPATFVPGMVACGPEAHESEVLVTNGLGKVTTIRIELCPGVEAEAIADLPQ